MKKPRTPAMLATLALWASLGLSLAGLAGCDNGAISIALPGTPPPPQHYLYVAVSGTSSVEAFQIDPATGDLTPVGPAAALGSGADGLATDPFGRFVYVANGADGTVSGFAIDPATGALSAVPGAPIAAGATPTSVAVHPSGQFAYVSNVGATGVVQGYTIDGATGVLSPIGGPATVIGGAWDVAIHPAGTYLYSGTGSATVAGFSINGATGVLSPIAGSPFPGGSADFRGMVVEPGGQYLYGNDDGNDNINWFTINGADGSLSAPSTIGTNPTNVTGIAVDPTGSNLYTASFGNNAVGIWDIQADGSITEPAPFSYAAGTGTWRVTMAVDGQYVYATNSASTTVSGYARDGATGVLTQLPTSPFTVGDAPRGIAVAKVP